MPLLAMMLICFIREWYVLFDPGIDDVLNEIELMRSFAGIELVEEAVPDETRILNFWQFLEKMKFLANAQTPIVKSYFIQSFL